MGLTKETKLQMIENRREAPEANAYAAELDLEQAKAAGNEAGAAEAKKRLDDAKAQLAALDKAKAAL